MDGFLTGTLCVLAYFVICVLIVFSIRLLFRIPKEHFRKLLHFVLLGSLIVWLNVYRTWVQVVFSAIAFALLVYPILLLAERIRGYSEFVTERKHGELKKSLLLVFFMFALITAVGWGIFGDQTLSLASIFAWGFGDAAAALIGKRFGKHHLQGRHIEGKKSVEGSAAMFIVSFCCVLPVLLIRGGMPAAACVVTAIVVCAVSTVTELFSMRGNDTFFCPVAAMAALLPLLCLFGGIR